MTNNPIKIIIVDDNKIFMKSLDFYLSNIKSYTIINKIYSGEELLNQTNIHNADIIIMDIKMVEINGIDTAKEVLYHFNWLKIIALTNYKEEAYLDTLIMAGFRGCIFKENTADQIEKAIHKVMSGGLFFHNNVLSKREA